MKNPTVAAVLDWFKRLLTGPLIPEAPSEQEREATRQQVRQAASLFRHGVTATLLSIISLLLLGLLLVLVL
jgi:hypothetical protein